MIKNISKICSFVLLFLFLVLILNQFEIMTYSDILKNIFYFLGILLIMLSSVITLLTNKSGFFKFLSVSIMLCLVAGGIMSIINPGLNIFIYICMVLSAIYSMIDMFYKPLWFYQ